MLASVGQNGNFYILHATYLKAEVVKGVKNF